MMSINSVEQETVDYEKDIDYFMCGGVFNELPGKVKSTGNGTHATGA